MPINGEHRALQNQRRSIEPRIGVLAADDAQNGTGLRALRTKRISRVRLRVRVTVYIDNLQTIVVAGVLGFGAAREGRAGIRLE